MLFPWFAPKARMAGFLLSSPKGKAGFKVIGTLVWGFLRKWVIAIAPDPEVRLKSSLKKHINLIQLKLGKAQQPLKAEGRL